MGFVTGEKVVRDNFYMALALEASYSALPLCIPNPPVGCVIVRDQTILCRGYTHPPGQYHAEAHALSQIQGGLRDATVYVTLEPCAFVGRTPSCAAALISEEASRVVIGLIDPDVRNSGRGVAMIRDAGIDISLGVLKEEIGSFIRPYLNLPQNKA